jgi:LysM repeat protein
MKPTPPQPTTAKVQAGDSYPSIARKHPSNGLNNHQRATQIHELNNGKQLHPGDTIKI